QRTAEPRVAAAARRVVREASRVDRTADCGIPLTVQVGGRGEPRVVRLGAEDPCPGRVARRDVDVFRERLVAELGEPEAVLLDEVEREPVTARRDRRADRKA